MSEEDQEKKEEEKEKKEDAPEEVAKQYEPLSTQTVFTRVGLMVAGVILLCVLAYFSK